jgi:hypothetical protein
MFEARLFQERCTRAYPDPFNLVYCLHPVRNWFKSTFSGLAMQMDHRMDLVTRMCVGICYPLWVILALRIDILDGDEVDTVASDSDSDTHGRSAMTAFCDGEDIVKDIEKARREYIKQANTQQGAV